MPIPGKALTETEITKLLKIMSETKRTIAETARKMHLNYFELYNPLNKRTRCSKRVYDKIKRFLRRYR